MGENTIMTLNQPPISWHPVAPARYLALVLAGRPKYSPQARARATGRDGSRIIAATLTWLMSAYSELTRRLGCGKRVLSV